MDHVSFTTTIKCMTRLVACLFALLAVACTAEPIIAPQEASPRTERTPKKVAPKQKPSKEPPRKEMALIYVQGTKLRAYDAATGLDVELRKIPGPDVALSLDGTQMAVVIDRQPGADPEGFADPFITVADATETGPGVPLGPGLAPHWSPDGSSIAALTDGGVTIYSVASGDGETVIGGQGWSLLGWTEGGIAAVGRDGIVVGRVGSQAEILDFDQPSGVWGVSPVIPKLLYIDENRADFMGFDGSTGLVRARSSALLGDGAWAPDGSTVAVTDLKGRSRMLLLDPATGEATEMSEGEGAQGNVVWSDDSRSFAFVRVDPDDRVKLQAVVCEVSGPCVPGFSWDRGVLLLGFAEV